MSISSKTEIRYLTVEKSDVDPEYHDWLEWGMTVKLIGIEKDGTEKELDETNAYTVKNGNIDWAVNLYKKDWKVVFDFIFYLY